MIPFYVILNTLTLLFTIDAIDANRAATISMKKVALGSVYHNYMFRIDELDSLCLTKVVTNTHRQEACTITVDCT
jgi:hypothetical protein